MDAKALIGLIGPAYAIDIERGKIREFAKATYSGHPAYLDDPRPVTPPTFLIVAGYTWGYSMVNPCELAPDNAALDLDLMGTLDAENEFIFHGPPPRAGQRLWARGRYEDVYTKQGRRGGSLTFFRMVTAFTDDRERPVADLKALWIMAERSPEPTPGGPVPLSNRPFWPRERSLYLLADVKRQSWDRLEPSEGPGPITLPPLTLTEVVRYQGAIGSFSPLHHDDACARASGYPAFTSVGMLHAGALATYATNWLGPEHVRRFKASFRNIVWPGDALTYSGTVLRKYEEMGVRKLDIGLTCRRQGGDVAVSAEATFVAP